MKEEKEEKDAKREDRKAKEMAWVARTNQNKSGESTVANQHS